MNHDHDHKMCDWCGNETGKKYRWARLIIAIVIGLFIFSAGYHLGELNVLVHGQYGQMSGMMEGHGDRMRSGWGQTMMMDDQTGYSGTTTTVVVPAMPVAPTPAPTTPARP